MFKIYLLKGNCVIFSFKEAKGYIRDANIYNFGALVKVEDDDEKEKEEKESRNFITLEFFVPTVDFKSILPNSIFLESLCNNGA